MTKERRNGTIRKVIIGSLATLLVTLFVAALTFLLNTSWKAAEVVKDVETNRGAIQETRAEIKVEIRPKIITNTETLIGMGKDIDQLDEKMDDLRMAQQAIQTEQNKAFKEILSRLPP
uniref:Uncharacterized protein n=1 Tax=viral metagenome TaxID=1070528 RepID=A0A6M3JD77_9ZZZZ